VSFDSLHIDDEERTPTGRIKRKLGPRKSKTVDIPGLADGFKLLYEIPVLLKLGEHWTIDELEAIELSKAFTKALGTSDNKNFQRVLKLIEKYIPVVALLVCVYLITAPRVQQTIELINDAKRPKIPVQESNPKHPFASGDTWTAQADSQKAN